MPKIIITPFAQNDIRNALLWLETQQEGLYEELDEEILRALSQIAANPRIFKSIGKAVRRCLLRRFNYHVYFVELKSHISIIGFYHTSRNPKTIIRSIRRRI